MLTTENMNDLVDRLDHDINPMTLTRELLDYRTYSSSGVLSSSIAQCVGVRIYRTTRKETNVMGESDLRPFYCVFGLAEDVETALWLFDLIEDTIGAAVIDYINKYAFSISDKKILLFQSHILEEIKAQLDETIDYSHDEKEAVVARAFAQLNIKIVKKRIDHARPTPTFTAITGIA